MRHSTARTSCTEDRFATRQKTRLQEPMELFHITSMHCGTAWKSRKGDSPQRADIQQKMWCSSAAFPPNCIVAQHNCSRIVGRFATHTRSITQKGNAAWHNTCYCGVTLKLMSTMLQWNGGTFTWILSTIIWKTTIIKWSARAPTGELGRGLSPELSQNSGWSSPKSNELQQNALLRGVYSNRPRICKVAIFAM